ncbi:Uncharacterized protein HZ326_31648 [Fusarium oxysporum f. sp. albedinis]|nr:Uncharacterized protein HZ326_31648 [Fusarium oxysporum f. sp. albedinis]
MSTIASHPCKIKALDSAVSGHGSPAVLTDVNADCISHFRGCCKGLLSSLLFTEIKGRGNASCTSFASKVPTNYTTPNSLAYLGKPYLHDRWCT